MDTIDEPWPAPAKLNRFLRIIGRRSDGYHLLQTLFQFLDYADWLNFAPRSDDRIVRCGGATEVSAESDLSVRAAALLRQYGGIRNGVTIHIDKNLPLGGGLGGGSSDAATTLVALNHYWRLNLSLVELAELGLRLGADVPVFVHGQAAWAEGIGEQLTPIEPDQPWFVVLIPPCRVETATIFSDPALTRNAQARKMRPFVSETDGNDCESVVFRRFPEIAAAATWLGGFSQPRLTGTGACVFAAFADQAGAQEVLACVPAPFSGFVSRGRNYSPLHERLQRARMAPPILNQGGEIQ